MHYYHLLFTTDSINGTLKNSSAFFFKSIDRKWIKFFQLFYWNENFKICSQSHNHESNHKEWLWARGPSTNHSIKLFFDKT